MPGYLDLARRALAHSEESAHPARLHAEPLPSAGREVSEVSEVTPVIWDQAEADRLLDHLRRRLARLERAWPKGQFPPVKANVVRIAVEVCESYVRDHDLEAARGWDALALLRAAVPWAVGLATPPTPRRTSP
jgi:hypothetical protein